MTTSTSLKIRTPYDPEIIKIMKTIPNALWSPTDKVWEISPEFYDYLPKVLHSPDLDKQFEAFKKDQELTAQKFWSDVDSKEINYPKSNYELLPFQKRGVKFLLMARKGILGADMGTGKTFQAISASKILLESNPKLKFLIIAPASLRLHWKNELNKFYEEKSIVVDGSPAKRDKLYEEYFNSKIPYLIISFETLRVKRDFNRLRSVNWGGIIVDEATRIKNHKIKTSKLICSLNSAYRWALTGCPLENSISDLFGIMKFVNPDIFVSWSIFKNTFLVTRPVTIYNHSLRRYVTYDEIIGTKNIDLLKDKIKTSMLRVKKRDVLTELPERSDIIYKVELEKSQRRIYDRYVAQALASDNPLGYITYLREIVNFPQTINEVGGSGKMEELLNILNETDEKLIIFSQFVKTLECIKSSLPPEWKSIMVSGSDSALEKERKVEEFKNYEGKAILLSSDVLSYGFNLQFARVLINFDVPYNPAKLDSRNSRIDRLGQKEKILIINLIAKNTIEDEVWRILTEKTDLINKIAGLDNPSVGIADIDFVRKFISNRLF